MSSAIRHRWRRLAVIGATASVAMLAVVGSASAHVTVHPDTAVQGGDATVAFQVPNEEDTASTTQLQVSFPTDHPIPSVAIQAVPGWTATVQKATLATPVNTDNGAVPAVRRVAGQPALRHARSDVQGRADLRQRRRRPLDR